MIRLSKMLTGIAAVAIASLGCEAATASTFSGSLPVGYSDSLYQIGDASFLSININAIGVRAPALCPACNNSYTDNFVLNWFDQTGAALGSVKGTNYFYASMYTNSHGIGAGPVGVAVPAGATTLEIISQLSIVGLLGLDGNPLNFGNVLISSNGSIAAATPIPSSLPLLATGLLALGLLGWRLQGGFGRPATSRGGDATCW